MYGFYTGATTSDLTTADQANYAKEVVMKAVDYDKCYETDPVLNATRPVSCGPKGFRDQALGDYISLEGEVSVEYWFNGENTAPYTAFFTGGDRLYGCAYAQQNPGEFPGYDVNGVCGDTTNVFGLNQPNGLLRNNAEGRYRLETTVYIAKGTTNKSPFAMMPPLIVLQSQPLGTPVQFTIPAYDPDGDALMFRMGNHREYGGSIRSFVDVFPYENIYQRLDALNQTGVGTSGEIGYDVDAASPTRGMIKPFARNDTMYARGRQLGNFGCNFYDVSVLESGVCSSDRLAGAPLGSTVSSSGMVDWHAWTDGTAACESSGDAGCSRLPTGLYNFVVMVEEVDPSGTGRVKVPVDFLAYLYDGTVSFCGENCDNVALSVGAAPTLPVTNTGVPTFADRDGVYGAEVSGNQPVTQKCTICEFNGASQACDPLDPLNPSTCTCKINTPPMFYQSSTGEHNNIPETPMLTEWKQYASTEGAALPYMIYYKGETVEFYVTAYDTDDCAEVYIDATALPYGPNAQSNISEPIYETDYPDDIGVSYPQGQMVRKKFAWEPPAGSTWDTDTRPDTSLACFTASDKYLYHTDGTDSGILKPYCVEIRLVNPPAQEEQALFRFDWDTTGTCSDPKLAIGWHPVLRRYILIDQGTRYYTTCVFEEYMWHHAFVTISDDRVARLYIDGEVQELMKEVGLDPAQPSTYDQGIVIGTEVQVVAYVNKCKASPPPAPYWWTCNINGAASCPTHSHEFDSRRRLSSIYDPREVDGTLSITSDNPVTDGFRFDYDPALNYVTEPGLEAPTGDCCGFRIGAECPGESGSFDGFIDEVVVYNREVSVEDIKTIMFKMPQYLPARELEAPRGVQHDLSAGRVLWARFNNPCMEGPIPVGQTVNAPRDGGGRRRLQQITGPAHTIYNLLSTDAANNTGRRLGVSDKAGMNAGGAYTDNDGDTWQKILDSDSDRTNFIKFRDSSRYAYTGVPWLAPTVSRVDVDRVSVSTANPLPLDGGIEVTMAGVGFARSPWLKCVSMQPDVRAEFETKVLEAADKYEARTTTDPSIYDNFFKSLSRKEIMIESKPWRYEDMEGVLMAGGATLLEPDEWSPYLLPSSKKHPQNKGKTAYDPQCTTPDFDPIVFCPYNDLLGWENAPTCAYCPDADAVRLDWHPTSVRNPNVPAYEQMPSRATLGLDPLTAKYEYTLYNDFIYGGWEKVTCSIPPAAFPSDQYYVGVSNDGGLTGSPATSDSAEAVTFTEYALELDGTQYLEMQGDVASGRTFSMWFMPKSLSGFQMLMNLTGGVGVGMDEGGMYVFSSDSQVEYPREGEYPVNVTAGEWHHMALVLSGTSGSTVKFFVDGEEVLSNGTIVLDAGNPVLTTLGMDFVGYMDEVKVFLPAKDSMAGGQSEMYELMWDREKPNPNLNNLKLYLRFNAPSAAMRNSRQAGLYDSSGNFALVDCMPSGSECDFLPVPAPWEPTSIYEINDDGPSVFSFPMTGGDALAVKGFNFAPSKWLKCGWSRDLQEVYSRTFDATLTVNPTDQCPYPVGSLNSVLGKPDQLLPYSVYQFNNDTTTFTNATTGGFSSWSDDYENTMELDCMTPLIEADVYHMAVSGQKFLNTFPFEITDVSLYCNGSVYATAPAADTTSILATSTKGYTFTAWVMPFAMPPSDETEEDDSSPREVASDRLGHRRTYLPEEKPEQTIFAMENPVEGDVKHAGMLMYDGVRFVYYDDCILDVTSTLDYGSRPNEWHFVAVRIDEFGEGDLFVDGIMVEHFTTVCKPMDTASFSICMDLDKNNEPSAFFHGLVDEVKVISQSLEDADLRKYMFNQKAHEELSRNVAYYTFDSCVDAADATVVPPAELLNQAAELQAVGPNLTVTGATCDEGDLLVPSVGPWRPARLMAQGEIEGGVSGGHQVRVVAANMAVSRWLGVTFNGEFAPAVEMDGPNVMIVNTPSVDGETLLVEEVSNWAGAVPNPDFDTLLPAVSAEDTVQVLLKGSVQDLGTSLEAYYTFDAAESDASLQLMVNLSYVSINDTDALFDFAGYNRNGAIESGLNVPDRDGYENGAVFIDGDAVAYLPPPRDYMDVTAYTVCMWMQFSYGDDQAKTTLPDSFASFYGAWKMYCMVRAENGTVDVYVNTEATSDAEVKDTFQVVIDSFLETGTFLLDLPAAAAVDDLWIYSRALSPTEIVARYYTNSIAIDFGKPAFDTGFGGVNEAAAPDPMSADYAPGLMWPMEDPLMGFQKLLSASGAGMSMMAKMMSMDDQPDMTEPVAPVLITNLDVPEVSPTFTAWIYPWDSDEDDLTTIFADSEGRWSLGLRGQRLSFYVYTDCPCEPCSQYREVVSWKAKVLPERWTHIAAKYDNIETGIPGNVITLYLDGVLMDKKVFTEYGTKMVMSSSTASVGSAFDGSGRFNGLIFSVGIHDDFVPWLIKREVQCPQRDPKDFVLYLGGSKAASWGNRTAFVMGVAPEASGAVLVGQLPASVYINGTYDDPTVAEAITITGPDHQQKYGGFDGDYIITARTTCGKKRVHGGDDIQVTMTMEMIDPNGPVFDTSSLITVTDHEDGNYHVTYTGLQCGTYTTNVTLGGDDVTSFTTQIMPGATSPTDSLLLTEQTGSCLGPFGVVHTLQIQAKDAAGCNQDSGDDVITVHVSGPADIVVTAQHIGQGRYEAKFVPPAHGKYFVQLKLTNSQYLEPVDFTATPYLCVDICPGHSIDFDSTGSVETSPAVTAMMDAEMDDGEITMEAWINPAQMASDGFILHKGTVQEADDNEQPLIDGYSIIKGYSLKVSANLQFLTASVYVGLGEYVILEIPASFTPNVWAHVSVTYNGTVMTAYKDGEWIAATTPSATVRPMHQNMYGHPLNVGYRFIGQIDEPTIWKRALEAEEVAGKMYCPKFLDMDDVVVYMPFNDDVGSTELVAFGGPVDSGDSPYLPYGLAAVVNSTEGGFALQTGTPYDGATVGVGIPGSQYSIISPGDDVVAGAFESIVLNLQAFDQCGYHYIGQGQGDFRLQLTQFSLQYYDQADPIADGVPMYPIMVSSPPMDLVDAQGLPGTCYASDPIPPYYRGDLFKVVGEALVAGTYKAQVTTRDGDVLQDNIDVEVHARLGEQSDVEIMTIPDTEAGVSAAVRFTLGDGFENTIMDDHSDDIVVSIYQSASMMAVKTISSPWFDESTGEYLVSFLAGSPVEHTIDITVISVNATASAQFAKTRPSWRKLLTKDGEVPAGTRRFEAGGAADPESGDLYIWGGASADKSYLNDVWALRGVDPSAEDAPTVLAYSKTVTVTSAKPLPDATVVEISVDTASLISSGKMHHKCNDLYFTMPENGDYLLFYVDTFADHACGTQDTTVYLQIPGGLLTEAGASIDVEMYYGAPGHYWPNPYSKPGSVFAFYEGFEEGTMGDFMAVEPCSQEPTDDVAFMVEKFKESYSGSYALHALEGAKGVLKAAAEKKLESFSLRAWFWDSNAHEAAHFISPDYSDCGLTAGADVLLPEGGPLSARSTAVGVYTLSHQLKYCVSSPWQSSGLNDLRSAEWHRLEITSTPETGLTVSIDGQVIKNADPISLDKVLLSTGYSADGVGHDFLASAHAYFDEISVVELSMCDDGPCVSSEVGTAEMGVAKYVEEMEWEKVETEGSTAPPARYGHSSVTYDGGMLIFGGERSSYAFNDVWWFSFEHQIWHYLAPKSATAPPPRFDHAAAIVDGHMYISGGRSGTGEVLSDMWVMDLESRVWTEIPDVAAVVGGRFGHAAAAGPSGDYVYLYGGYQSDPAAFSNKLFRCTTDGGVCEDISDGCPGADVPSGARATGVGLSARTGHSMLPTSTGVVVFGGSDFSTIEPTGSYMFDEATCSWSLLSLAAGEIQGSTRTIDDIVRHDHAAMKMDVWMVVQGGVAGGDFEDSVYILATP